MKPNSFSRRRLLAGASAVAAATTTPVAATALSGVAAGSGEPSDDPIFAAIEAFNATRDALNNHPAYAMDLTFDQEDEMIRPAEKAWVGAQDDLFWKKPTTIEGLLAFIDFLKDQEEFREGEEEEGEFPDLPEWWPGAALQVIAESIRTMLAGGVIR
jgi:hypothetical protein